MCKSASLEAVSRFLNGHCASRRHDLIRSCYFESWGSKILKVCLSLIEQDLWGTLENGIYEDNPFEHITFNYVDTRELQHSVECIKQTKAHEVNGKVGNGYTSKSSIRAIFIEWMILAKETLLLMMLLSSISSYTRFKVMLEILLQILSFASFHDCFGITTIFQRTDRWIVCLFVSTKVVYGDWNFGTEAYKSGERSKYRDDYKARWKNGHICATDLVRLVLQH